MWVTCHNRTSVELKQEQRNLLFQKMRVIIVLL